ncbi:unnamed protein product [Symbiodinium necroappetens]|uniref:Uncharacterized protein n=1 Tax=Symbiodinium necroappetens TaxID=1628268 RepID=A0A813AMZ6_9DINO|nr:unnamed protein product [Symbiodinium necroappetens]
MREGTAMGRSSWLVGRGFCTNDCAGPSPVQQRYQCMRERQSLEVGRAPKSRRSRSSGVLLLLLPLVKSSRSAGLV